MSSTGKDDKRNAPDIDMNKRIPRKTKKASSLDGNNKPDTAAHSESIATITNQPATDILSFRIPRKSKDGASSNDKKRTHDVVAAPIATKKVKHSNNETSTTQQDNNNIPPSQDDNNKPTYQIVKEGRVSGYPIIVSQVGSEHDAILLGCKPTDNPREYLDRNINGKVKIRWKFAGYNDHVPTHTVRLKVVDLTPPIRKAAALSGLLETEVVANKKDDVDLLGAEEDDNAPILKAIRSDILDGTVRSDKDEDLMTKRIETKSLYAMREWHLWDIKVVTWG